MNEQELRETLNALRAEIGRLKLEPEESRRLNQLVAEAEADLADSRDPEARGSLVEELSQAIERFEVDHPRFTAMLGRVVSTLSSMGI